VSINLRRPFGLRDCKVFEITDHSTPTYDTGVDVPCVQELTFDPSIVEATLEGDDSICATHSNIEAVEFSITHGGLDLNVYATLAGITLTDSGASPNEATLMDMAVSDVRPYVGVIADSRGAEGNSLFVFYKSKLIGGGGGTLSKGSFMTPAYNFRAVTCDYNSDTIMRIINYETATAINTTWATNHIFES